MRKLRNILINHLTKSLLRAVREEDVLRPTKKGGIIVKGRELSYEEVQALAMEANALSQSRALKLILADLEYLANQTMFEKSKTFDDMLFGKAMLYNIDILRKKITNLESMKR